MQVVLAAVNSLHVFGVERVLLAREREAGVNMLALFVAKCGVDVAENVWQPLFFLGVCYSLILPATAFHRLYAKLVLLSFCGSGLGILMGVVLDSLNMTITGAAPTRLDFPTCPPSLVVLKRQPRWSPEAWWESGCAQRC